jgi:hypothetical protein
MKEGRSVVGDEKSDFDTVLDGEAPFSLVELKLRFARKRGFRWEDHQWSSEVPHVAMVAEYERIVRRDHPELLSPVDPDEITYEPFDV